jgi:hypothetical protein
MRNKLCRLTARVSRNEIQMEQQMKHEKRFRLRCCAEGGSCDILEYILIAVLIVVVAVAILGTIGNKVLSQGAPIRGF